MKIKLKLMFITLLFRITRSDDEHFYFEDFISGVVPTTEEFSFSMVI
jgi:hypothetical protein